MKNASNTPANTKFTAAMVHEADKVRVQSLRESLNLGEKDTMKLLIDLGLEHEDTLNLRAMELITAADKAKATEKEAKVAAKAQAAANKAAEKAAAAAEKAIAAAKAAEVPAAPEAPVTEEAPTVAE